MGGSSWADPESFVRGGPQLSTLTKFFFFYLMRGGRIKIPLSGGHHWPTSETPFKWPFSGRADDGPTLNVG